MKTMRMTTSLASMAIFGAASVLAACGSSDANKAAPAGGDSGTGATYATSVALNMQMAMQGNLQDLVASAQALQAAAPTHAWDLNDPAWAAMDTAWIQARHDYEHVEGATAPIYPDIDITIDGRVEDFGPGGAVPTLSATSDMFGTGGMSGLHAVERILYAAPVVQTPQAVVDYETGLGYVPAQSFPATDAEAVEFKNVLCAKLIADAQTLLAGWTTANIDVGEAFNGLIGLMNESHEKVAKAGLHQEESRYSQRTMDDLRENLDGTTAIYAVFEPWLMSQSGGSAIDAKIHAGFSALSTLYAAPQYAGVAFPEPPADWSDVSPSAADLATTFGTLYASVTAAIDPTADGSVVFEMNAAAVLLGLPPFQG